MTTKDSGWAAASERRVAKDQCNWIRPTSCV